MTSKIFEEEWKKLEIKAQFQGAFTGDTSDPSLLKNKLKDINIKAVAQGIVKNIIKFYLYAQEEESESYILMELLINTEKKVYSAKIKSESEDIIPLFKIYFEDAINI